MSSIKVICLNNENYEDQFEIGDIYIYHSLKDWSGGIPESNAIILDKYNSPVRFIKPFFNKKFKKITQDELRIKTINFILEKCGT